MCSYIGNVHTTSSPDWIFLSKQKGVIKGFESCCIIGSSACFGREGENMVLVKLRLHK